MSDPLVNSLFLSLVTAEGIREILGSFKKGDADYDEIRSPILKYISLYALYITLYISLYY